MLTRFRRDDRLLALGQTTAAFDFQSCNTGQSRLRAQRNGLTARMFRVPSISDTFWTMITAIGTKNGRSLKK